MIKKIGIIGAGVMGEVFISRLINELNFSAKNIIACAPNRDRLKELNKKYKIKVSTDNKNAVLGSDLVILAIKPQQAKVVLTEIAPMVKNQIFLSVMAGVSLSSIKKILPTEKIVRCMPNTPAQIGCGMTVWLASGVDAKNKKEIKKILRVLGEESEVKAEKYIDMATAVSGSGPAYVFDFADNLINAAVNLGFDKKTANKLVAQTIFGSASLLKNSALGAADLRKKVVSKGGTTQAAFKIIGKHKLNKVYQQAIKAAYKRAGLLSRFF